MDKRDWEGQGLKAYQLTGKEGHARRPVRARETKCGTGSMAVTKRAALGDGVAPSGWTAYGEI